MKRWRPKDPIKVAARRSAAQRRVGRNARCACGESRPEALIRGTKPIRCLECQRKRSGHSPTDGHHVAGENNSPLKIRMPVNDHQAAASLMQWDWPSGLLENPRRDPIVRGAAILRGSVDMIILLIEFCVDTVVALLVALAEYLRTLWGDNWWLGTPIEVFAPKA